MGYVYPVSPPDINLVALRHLVCSMLFSYLSCALCTNDSLRDEIHIHLQWMRSPRHTRRSWSPSLTLSHMAAEMETGWRRDVDIGASTAMSSVVDMATTS